MLRLAAASRAARAGGWAEVCRLPAVALALARAVPAATRVRTLRRVCRGWRAMVR